MAIAAATGQPDTGGLIEQLLDFNPPDVVDNSTDVVDLRCGDVIDVLNQMDAESVQTVITSPPYFGLRVYGIPPRMWADGLECVLGEEPSLAEYLGHLVEVFQAVRRVLRPDGTLWLNLGDSYAGGGKHVEPRKYAQVDARKPTRQRQRGGLTGKDLLMVPARAALALQLDGWILRSDIIWAKGVSFCDSFSGSVMPESTRDRPTWSHEHVCLLTKQESYFYDIDGCREPYAGSTRREADGTGYRGRARKDYASAGAQNPSNVKRRVLDSVAGGTGRNLRNVWIIPKQNFAGLHFATFPEALVTPMIQLGTSAHGECVACGTPWRRVVEKSAVPVDVQASFEASRAASAADTGRTDGHTLRRPNHIREVIGERWEPWCACEDAGRLTVGVRPQTVLDIFNGSGRTGIAAVKQGRRYVGIDINPDYITIAQAAIWEAYRGRHQQGTQPDQSVNRPGRLRRRRRRDRVGDNPGGGSDRRGEEGGAGTIAAIVTTAAISTS